MSKIEVRHVYKIFGPRAGEVLQSVRNGAGKDQVLADTGHTVGLRDVTLSIEAGKTFVVMGLSGSGKSTLIRHFNRLIDPTAGEVVVDGVDILSLSKRELIEFRRHKTSMVFQRFGLFPHRKVIENVAYGLAVQGVGREERERRAREWIEAVGLGGYEEAWPDQLSGGMQQRVGLARALCTDPDILLMDEAFSALDPLIRRDMQDQLIDLQTKLHKTIVFITHDLDEALRLGDRIAILKDGEVVQVGAPQEILLQPADDYVEAFVKDVNRGRVLTARVVMNEHPATAHEDEAPAAVLEKLAGAGGSIAYVLDPEERPVGVVTQAALEEGVRVPGATVATMVEPVPTAQPSTVLEQLLQPSLDTPWPVAIVNRRGALVGIVSREAVLGGLADTPAAAAEAPRPATAGRA